MLTFWRAPTPHKLPIQLIRGARAWSSRLVSARVVPVLGRPRVARGPPIGRSFARRASARQEEVQRAALARAPGAFLGLRARAEEEGRMRAHDRGAPALAHGEPGGA